MNRFLRLRIAVMAVSIFVFSSATELIAQVQTARYISMTANSSGYYEYLPQGYDPAGTATYPLIVFSHGAGELQSNPGNPVLSSILGAGLPSLIDQGNFPSSFTVGGQTFKFIVISPQFINWPVASDIEDIINYTLLHYKVNLDRIYLTGLSMGGGVTFDYAGTQSSYTNRLAAILPISGALWPDNAKARVIAAANLPVWATHNDGDPTVPVYSTNQWIDYINTAPAPTPLAKKTIFVNNIHDAWTHTYDPTFTENGMNVYEWMLQYQRNNLILPVTLTNYTVNVTSQKTVSVLWTTSQEQNDDHFTIERSADGVSFTALGKVTATNMATGNIYSYLDKNPLNGESFYRLTQTDVNGKTTYFDIKKVTFSSSANELRVYPNPAKDNILIEMTNAFKGKMNINIINAEGKLVKTVSLIKSDSYLQQALIVNDLVSGLYTIEIKGTNYSSSISFIKQ